MMNHQQISKAPLIELVAILHEVVLQTHKMVSLLESKAELLCH
jgi:hypothetical protein